MFREGTEDLLEEGEADLPEQSVVVLSQLFTVDKEDLLDTIGLLSVDCIERVFEASAAFDAGGRLRERRAPSPSSESRGARPALLPQ